MEPNRLGLNFERLSTKQTNRPLKTAASPFLLQAGELKDIRRLSDPDRLITGSSRMATSGSLYGKSKWKPVKQVVAIERVQK